MKSINVVVGVSLFGLIAVGLTSLLSNDPIRLFNAYRLTLLTGGGQQCISSLREQTASY
jgi:hypothetical protein